MSFNFFVILFAGIIIVIFDYFYNLQTGLPQIQKNLEKSGKTKKKRQNSGKKRFSIENQEICYKHAVNKKVYYH